MNRHHQEDLQQFAERYMVVWRAMMAAFASITSFKSDNTFLFSMQGRYGNRVLPQPSRGDEKDALL